MNYIQKITIEMWGITLNMEEITQSSFVLACCDFPLHRVKGHLLFEVKIKQKKNGVETEIKWKGWLPKNIFSILLGNHVRDTKIGPVRLGVKKTRKNWVAYEIAVKRK